AQVFFFQAEDGIRDRNVTGVQTCALPILQVKMGMLPHTKALENGGRLLAIGQKAAYYTGTRYLVNMVEGSGFWGYDGIIRLAQWMRDAAKEEADVENIIQVKGWGCCG